MTTIVAKLNLNKYTYKAILNQPPKTDYFEDLELANLTFELTHTTYDLIFTFAYSKEDFMSQIKQLTANQLFNNNSYLFIAYPKIGNDKYPNTIHRDEIFPSLEIDPNGDGYLGDTLFKFSRMVSLDDYFTVVGLKYTPKKTSKKKATSNKVADYISLIPTITEKLVEHPDILPLFTNLTPGYQRGWARYIYSAKQTSTQEKRYAEMLTVLRAGYKSKDLYQRR